MIKKTESDFRFIFKSPKIEKNSGKSVRKSIGLLYYAKITVKKLTATALSWFLNDSIMHWRRAFN